MESRATALQTYQDAIQCLLQAKAYEGHTGRRLIEQRAMELLGRAEQLKTVQVAEEKNEVERDVGLRISSHNNTYRESQIKAAR